MVFFVAWCATSGLFTPVLLVARDPPGKIDQLAAHGTDRETRVKQGIHDRTLKIGNLERRYVTCVPAKYDPDIPTPVVLVYHGGGTNPESMMRFCGMNEKAEAAGFLAVYPAGTGRLPTMLTFNGGNCCGYASHNKVDDVAFTRLLLDDLQQWLNVDARRVYATGMSNGGIVAYLVASELADRIAAIAPVGGPMGTESCSPARPVSILHFHGTEDAYAPYAGGKGKGLSGTIFFSVEHSIQRWVKANGCQSPPVEATYPDESGEGMQIVRKTFGGGKDGSEVVLVTIIGAGHTWPGKEPTAAFLGKSTKQISANDMMWEFFQKHPMPPAADSADSSRKGTP